MAWSRIIWDIERLHTYLPRVDSPLKFLTLAVLRAEEWRLLSLQELKSCRSSLRRYSTGRQVGHQLGSFPTNSEAALYEPPPRTVEWIGQNVRGCLSQCISWHWEFRIVACEKTGTVFRFSTKRSREQCLLLFSVC